MQNVSSKIHTFSGHASKGDKMDILCKISFKTENAIENKMNFKINLKMQAKKIKINSERKIHIASLGATVRVPVSDVYKGRGDLHNILSAVMSVTDDGFYRLGTYKEIFKQVYVRS